MTVGLGLNVCAKHLSEFVEFFVLYLESRDESRQQAA